MYPRRIYLQLLRTTTLTELTVMFLLYKPLFSRVFRRPALQCILLKGLYEILARGGLFRMRPYFGVSER